MQQAQLKRDKRKLLRHNLSKFIKTNVIYKIEELKTFYKYGIIIKNYHPTYLIKKIMYFTKNTTNTGKIK